MPSKNAGTFPINISLRCRPRNKKETDMNSPSIIKCNTKENKAELNVKVAGKINSKTYNYDNVFGPDSSQLDVYEAVVAPSLKEVMQGFNCTVFAYGQTGTGKTHTMEGVRSSKMYDSYKEDPDAGLVPRTMMHVFEMLEAGASEYSVRVSFLEIYNEEIFDLLGDEPIVGESQRLRLFEDSNRKGSVIIQGLEEVTLHHKHDVFKILQKGAEKRRVAETKMNKASSRSHSVFSVTIHQKENNVEGEELLKTGKLYLVDLAGAENVGRSGAVKDRAAEAGNINKSLLTLGRVISKLVERSQHIPYRESKLTRLLQDSLGGRTKTSIIATVSPAACNMEESQSTMEYAVRAKNILNKPEANQKVTKREVIKEYTNEIAKLKRDLQAAREKDGVYLSHERYSAMGDEITSQKQLIEELEEKIQASTEQLGKITGVFETTSKALEETSEKLKETESSLNTVTAEYEQTAEKLDEQIVKTEETEFLLENRVETEEQLYREATSIMEVTGTTTSHVEALHEKVLRKNLVEQHNDTASNQFADIISSECTKMTTTINSFASGQANTINKLQQDFQSSMASTLNILEGACQKLKGLSSSAIEKGNSQVSNIEGAQMDIASSSSSNKAMFSAQVETHSEFVNNNVDTAIATKAVELQNMLKSQISSISEFTGRIEEQCGNATSRLAAFVQANTQSMESLSAFVESHVAQQIDQLNSRMNQLSEIADTQKNAAENAMVQVQDQISSILQKFVADQASQLKDHMGDVSTKLSASVEQNTAFSGSLKEQTSSITRQADAYANDEKDAINQQRQYTTDHSKNSSGAFDNMTQQVSNIEATSSSASKEIVNRFSQLEKAFVTASNNVENTSSGFTKSMTESLKQSTTDTVDECTVVVNTVNECMSEYKSAMESSTTSLANVSENTTSHAKSMSAEIDSTSSKLTGHLESGFKKDVPTGETPQRQVYRYPTNLSKTRPHDELLATFRAKKARVEPEEDTDPIEIEADTPVTSMETEDQKEDSKTPPQISAGAENITPTVASKLPMVKPSPLSRSTRPALASMTNTVDGN